MNDRILHIIERFAGRAFRAMCGVALVSIISAFCVAALPEDAEARRIPWYYKNKYTLQLAVSLTYNYRNINGGSSQYIVHSYKVLHRGYALDPRLINYGVLVDFSQSLRISKGAPSWSSKGFTASLVLFEGINRNRGIKLWKYMPSPVFVDYGWRQSGSFTSQNYGLAMIYTRPGSVRLFSNGKFVRYDTRTRNINRNVNYNADINRYRQKYANTNYNVNSNGNWNRNRNLNGNGNGNWNRNRNLNGNGNWNRNRNLNGNGNWNRGNNYNSDWNRGNNYNSNWNYNLYQNINRYRRGRGLLAFTYPHIALDIRRTTTTGPQFKSNSTQGNIRFSFEDAPRMSRKKIDIRGQYLFNYFYLNSMGRGTRHDLVFHTNHVINRRLLISNNFVYRNTGGFKTYGFGTNSRYANMTTVKGQPVQYRIGVNGYWNKSGGSSTYGGVATVGTLVRRTTKLAPRLVASSSVDVYYARKQDSPSGGDNLWSIQLSDSVVSNQIKRTTIRLGLTMGVQESGIPLGARLTVTYVPNQKLTLYAKAGIASSFRKEYLARVSSVTAEAGVRFFPLYRVRLDASTYYSMGEETNGETHKIHRVTYRARLTWLISSQSRLEVQGLYIDEGTVAPVKELTVQYRTRIYRGTLNVFGRFKYWRQLSDGERTLGATYGWSMGRFSMSTSYRYQKRSNVTSHVFSLRVTRIFGRTLRRLW